MYPEITWRAEWAMDLQGTLCNNTAYILPTEDPWILAVSNAPVTWWYAWRAAIHGKDEALRYIKDFARALPIPKPSDAQRSEAETKVPSLIEGASLMVEMGNKIIDWLSVEHEIDKPTKRLQNPVDLDCGAFVAEVRKVRGKKRPLTAAALKNLRDEHTRTIEPARALAAEAVTLERRLSDLVNEAYGLTPDEVSLLWQTAPPRMPEIGLTGT